MIKRLVIIFMVLIFIFILAGCLSKEPSKFVGSIKSDIYHYNTCDWARKISTSNLIEFSSLDEAREQGYRPCFVCSPPR